MKDLPDVPEEFIGPLLPCLKLLENASIYIYDTEKSWWKKKILLSWHLVCMVVYQTSLTMYFGKVFRGELQMDELAFVMSVYAMNIQVIHKATVAIFKKKEIRSIVLEMGSLWRTEDLTEVQINKKNAFVKTLKFRYAVFYWIVVIAAWLNILAPSLEIVVRKFILQQDYELLLPFSCSFPFDPTETWARYIGVYIFEAYSMFRIVYYYIGMEFVMITLCSHLTTEFSLLHDDLLNLQPENLTVLKVIIQNQQKLISLSQRLDNVFDKMIFAILTSASISMCFFGFSVKVAHGVVPITSNFIAILCILLPLFNLCSYGEQLREASGGLADAVYESMWYQGDIRYQKLLWFIMRRSQKPCCLTSLKYKQITLNTFTTALSTTWSYFSLALSVYEDEN